MLNNANANVSLKFWTWKYGSFVHDSNASDKELNMWGLSKHAVVCRSLLQWNLGGMVHHFYGNIQDIEDDMPLI